MVSRVVGALTILVLFGCAREARVVAPTVVVVEPVTGATPIAPGGVAASTVSAWAPKEEVEVEWHGSWWPATLLDRRGAQHWLVHYDGWGDEWDEVVAEARIRERRAEVHPDDDEKSDDADP